MKKRQKFLAVFMMGCICMTAGCGKTADTENAAQETETVQEDVDAKDGQESPDTSEAASAPQIMISSENMENYEQDTGRWLVHTEYDTVSVAGDGYEAAAEGVRLWSEARAGELEKLASEYAEYASEDAAYQDAENISSLYSIYQNVESVRADRRVISLLEMSSEYTGGAHGNYGYYGYTFDTESGQLLEIADILEDAGGFQEAANEYIIQKLKETQGEGLFPEYADAVRDIWTRNEGPNWYLDAAGITFIFNPYEVGPYAMGEVTVTLPYEEFASYIKDEYEGIVSPGVAKIPADAPVCLFLDKTDDQANRLRIYQELDEYEQGSVYVSLNDSVVKAGEYTYGWIEGAYVVAREDGRTFVLLNMNAASDDFSMFVYEITDGTIQERDYVNDITVRNGVVNTENMALQANLDVLGTYTAMMNYVIGEDGKLEQQEEFFQIDSKDSAWEFLTNVKELPVTVDGEETMLPVGSRIRITATDNNGTAVFHNEDTGESGEIHYTRGVGEEDDWTIYIDGTPDHEYFEMLPYAG